LSSPGGKAKGTSGWVPFVFSAFHHLDVSDCRWRFLEAPVNQDKPRAGLAVDEQIELVYPGS